MNHFAIVVAGGKGTRMQSEIPKQFLLLKGKPILMHSLTAFHQFDQDLKIILVLPENQISFWNDLKEKYQFKIKHEIAFGGETRFHSVKNGLEKIKSEDGIVAIHDGVRPLLSQDLIKRAFAISSLKGSAIPVIPLKDSLRLVENESSKIVNRSNYRLVQTPQVFDIKSLKDAYKQPYKAVFTDDASVVEANGKKITLIDGEEINLKITTPNDLVFAENLWQESWRKENLKL